MSNPSSRILQPSVVVSSPDIQSKSQVKELLGLIPPAAQRPLVISYSITTATLRNLETQTYSTMKAALMYAFVPDSRLLTFVQYDYEPSKRHSRALPGALIDLVTLTAGMSTHVQGFQVDNWPSPEAMEAYRERYPDPFIIFKVGGGMAYRKMPVSFVAQVQHYGTAVDAYALDFGDGEISALTLEHLMALHAEARGDPRTTVPHIILEGAFDPENLHVLDRVVQVFPNVSIHAHLGTMEQARAFVARAYAFLEPS